MGLYILPITVAVRTETRTVFACSNTEIVVSNLTRGMDVCMRFFCVCVVLHGFLNCPCLKQKLTVRSSSLTASSCLLLFHLELCPISDSCSKFEVTSRLTASQSVSMSYYRTPLWNFRPDVTSRRNVAV
jgi:hypothetical protein